MTTIHDFSIKNGTIIIPIKEIERVADNLYAQLKRDNSDFIAGKVHFVQNLLSAIHYPKAYQK